VVACRADEEEREMGIVAVVALGSRGGTGAWNGRWYWELAGLYGYLRLGLGPFYPSRPLCTLIFSKFVCFEVSFGFWVMGMDMIFSCLFSFYLWI
jgi:hypothetical protein